MIRHVALLTFVEGATEAQVRAIEDALSTLPARLPQLRSYAIGRDLGINVGNASFAVVAEFANVDDYVVYRDDTEHRRIIAELISPILAARTGAQYDVP
ncbi:MAG TPA: Dabb family protein [Acidimicrobiia bacterium]